MQQSNKKRSPHIRSTSTSAGRHFKPDIMSNLVWFDIRETIIWRPNQLSDRIIVAHCNICDIWHGDNPPGYIHINDD